VHAQSAQEIVDRVASLPAGARFQVLAPLARNRKGTFQDVFPAYRLEITPGRQVWDKAHNDYLELILGLGVPAAAMVLRGLLLVAWRLLRGFLARRRDQHFAAIAFGACLLAGLHSMVDFSLQIQANTLTFALLLGLGLAQSISLCDS
jgi:O-antigen ligase